ncbi:ABC transporter permease [Tardiphaga sp.]|jgi:iron complex transport system permease protein|uniref:ABC transporter permease n=1 Tax=Tardiphaga sp. TaxID=1926292 RepID=UPI0037D9D77B
MPRAEPTSAGGRYGHYVVPGAAIVLLALASASLLVGVGDRSWDIMVVSRLPRTLALLLAGASLAVAGVLMQLVVQNRFVEPTTAGTAQSAGLGMLTVTILAPDAPIVVKMLCAAAFALAGAAAFLGILRSIPLRSTLTVPLIGIVFGGIVWAGTTMLAYRYDLLQTLATWNASDFSAVLRGRYELLWIGLGLMTAAYVAADRFTIAGLGRDNAVNLGLDYRAVVALALLIVALVTAATIVTVGIIPFLGLVAPNIVSLIAGDNLRRTLPLVAGLGAGLMLACDLIGRIVRFPFEIPAGTVMGVVGGGIFLYLLLRKGGRLA